MPLYAYRCTQCGYQYEKVQKFNAEPDTVCPQCGGTVERPLTAPALQFKGAGWYINDYAPKAASGGASKPASDAASTDGASKDTGSKTTAAPPAASAPAASTSKAD